MQSPELKNEELVLTFLVEGGDAFISGATMSEKLGLSPAELFKLVETLRRLGYGIEALPAKGYRLVEVPDRLTELEVGPLLTTRDLGRTMYFYESLPSTNARAFELAREGAFHGDVVIAEQQTEGRGRRGRTWISPPGKNLLVSAVLRPDVATEHAPQVTLVASVALAETIREAGVPAKIKWPNDVHLEGRKLAGILSELSAEGDHLDFIVLGLGVNLNASPSDFPTELAAQASSLFMARHRPVPRALFAAALFASLEHWIDVWTNDGFAPIRRAWRGLASTLGETVVVRGEAGTSEGFAEDIDDSGALLVRVGARLERVLSGDVEQLRARPAIASEGDSGQVRS